MFGLKRAVEKAFVLLPVDHRIIFFIESLIMYITFEGIIYISKLLAPYPIVDLRRCLSLQYGLMAVAEAETEGRASQSTPRTVLVAAIENKRP